MSCRANSVKRKWKSPKPAFWRSDTLKKTEAEMDKALSGRAARNKGKAFEQKVAVMFRAIFPLARRWLESHASDAKGFDLMNTGHYYVQLKCLRKYAPISCLYEVQCDRQLGDVPVLVTKGDGLEPVAVLPLAEFLRLVQITEGLK